MKRFDEAADGDGLSHRYFGVEGWLAPEITSLTVSRIAIRHYIGSDHFGPAGIEWEGHGVERRQ